MNEQTGNAVDTILAAPEAVLDWSKWAEKGRVPLVIIRHGQTAWNKERRFLGRMDIPLDGEGHAQAKAAASWLRGLPMAALYASPLSRAWQTAEAIGGACGLEAQAIDGLVELHQGELEGRPSADLPDHFPHLYKAWMRDPTDVRVPGGETMGECQARAIATFTELCSRQAPGPPAVVVSHKMYISSFICHVNGWPLSRYREIEQHNTAINLLSYSPDGGDFALHALNQTPHLVAAGTRQPCADTA
jgi:broad specificity phosphatase PhoE